jgi:arabinogalactan oligomer/maltooligosaccharide transport system permease protein
MKLPHFLQRALIGGMGIAMLLVLLLSSWVFRAEENDIHLQQRQRMAVLQANALLSAVADTDAAATRARVSAMQRLDPRIESVIIIAGTQMLASTRARDAAPRALQREEKALYDLSNLLRTARETNRGEAVVRKKTIQIDELPANRLVVTLPYLSGGEFAGILQMQFDPTRGAERSDSGTPLLMPLSILLLTLLLGALLHPHADKRIDPVKLLALAGFVLLVLLYQQQRMGQFEQGVMQDNRTLAASYLATAKRLAQQGYLPVPRDAAGVNRWDTDDYQRPRGLIASDGSIAAAAQTVQIAKRAGFIRPMLWAIDLLGIVVLFMFIYGHAARAYAAFRKHIDAYLYVAPAMIGMLVLVFFPFMYGITLSFTDTTLFNESLPFQDRLIGWGNFGAILGDFDLYQRTADGIIWNFQNFYWTLMVTVLWTVTNVALGVSVGFLLAMALNTEGLRGKAIYRVLLILPWAIPNYITALVWRGMFHPQFGVINQVLQMFGLAPVAWFDGVFSSFLTGVATNGWLSFPFMMVVILGALQSIPKDMYEAAEVEGASRWQRLRYITLPLLKPTLIPAIVLSVVWTFNMFNIIFLVSGGEPAGANEILVTKAYKIAFEQYQYAYAAAYSTVIFAILLVYGFFQTRITKATESF